MSAQLVSKISNLWSCFNNVTTDRRTTCNRKTALSTIAHRAVKIIHLKKRFLVVCPWSEWHDGWTAQ